MQEAIDLRATPSAEASSPSEKIEGKNATLTQIIARAEGLSPLPTAVVHPVDSNSLAGALEAAEHGIIKPWLIGPRRRIQAAADALGVSLRAHRVVDVEHSHAAADEAVRLASSGRVHALMKGALETSELLKAVLDPASRLRTERRISHIFVMSVPNYHKLLLITDAAINIQPDLHHKADIVNNAIDCARALGIDLPRIAILAAVEKVHASMPSTIHAAALCKMVDRRQIQPCLIDGPLAFDNAISLKAARSKNIESAVAGDVDVLVVPDFEAGNILAKQLQYLAGATGAGIVMGCRIPIILTSRADGAVERLASCAVAACVAQSQGRI